MFKHFVKLLLASVFSAFFAIICFNIPYYDIVNSPNVINLTQEDLQNLSNNKTFGHFISVTNSNVNSVSKTKNDAIDIVLKIFNLFPVKKIQAKVYDNSKIYASGDLIGFNIKTNGVIVEGINNVITDLGEVSPAKNSGIRVGDIITHIDGVKVSSNEEFNEVVNLQNSNHIHKVQYLRNNVLNAVEIHSEYDKITKSYRLGLWVKDETNGIGTLTYILEDNNKYGALGHAVTNSNGEIINATDGKIYDCNLLGIEKGSKGIAGSVKGLFVNDDNSVGTITKNTNMGLVGVIKDNSKIYKQAKQYTIGGRFSAHSGKAQILCQVTDGEAKLYDVEIIKANSQNNAKEKSIVLRIIDKELLNLTGGIVQGMSGSPIIQDNRIVGAVTHVFVNDPTKGYGIYLDWMLEKQ